MAKTKKSKISVQGTDINFYDTEDGERYMCLTDIAKRFGEAHYVIQNWMRVKSTIRFLGLWEEINNPDFNLVEFYEVKNQAGDNTFVMSSSKWIKEMNAKGMITKFGRYGGGTYAHRDIALEFCSWASPEFKLFLIVEFQKLKEKEVKDLDWYIRREISKSNYYIHSEAVREHLVPLVDVNTKREGYVFASEADVLNVAVFGITAKDWRTRNTDKKGNIRDHATVEQLLVLSNLESLNSKLIQWESNQQQRLEILKETAEEQLDILKNSKAVKRLKGEKTQKKLK